MKLSRRLFVSSLVAILCGLGGSCSKNTGKVKVAVVTNNPAEFWSIAEKGAKDAGEKFGVEVIFRMPEKGEAGLQRDIVNEVVRQGISGLSVSVINPEEQTPDLKLIGQKINLITMDNDAEGTGRLCYVGTDNYDAGKSAGRLVKEAMPQGGSIAIFVGNMTSLNARQRFQGVVDELAGEKDAKGPVYGKYTLYKGEAITDSINNQTAQDNAKDALEKMSGTENICMVGLYAYNAPMILQAVKAKKLAGKVKIVSFDEDAATLDAIQSGEIYGTIVQDPYNFGFKSVEILAEIARTGDKSKLPKDAIPVRVIVKEGAKDPVTGRDRIGAAQFAADLKKLVGK
ncbi:substrate-binding domain-containing protein [Zavarzinella formosa]|uniref:substrate-binding domain-containing protein n=1 Tax=Zavarzinella formosa TaxID=360055 RepID=UPI0002E3CB34|nr:substrate-binding domain-containing protein [Zavarzinella formosa]